MTNIVTHANAALGAKLLRQLAEDQPNQNIVFSPLSITLALLLAHAGAQGETAHAIGAALELGQATPTQIAEAASTLVQQLSALDQQEAQRSSRFGEAEDTVWLRIANAVFVNQEITLKPGYVTTVRNAYAALIEPLNFGAASAAAHIDAWVSDQTRGKITQIAGTLDRDTIAVLVNAVYFKAPWRDPFPEQATAEGEFTLRDGNRVRVPMMANTERFSYAQAAGYEVIGLPLAGGGNLEMLIVLPNRGADYVAIGQAVAQPAFFSSLALRPAQIRLRLPRFRIECDMSLNEVLAELGIGIAFDPQQADFSAMAEVDEPVYISEVRHKTFLDVNEKGVEAAAATAIKMMRMSMVVEQPLQVDVDRPFYCAIREQQRSAVLFLCAITIP